MKKYCSGVLCFEIGLYARSVLLRIMNVSIVTFQNIMLSVSVGDIFGRVLFLM